MSAELRDNLAQPIRYPDVSSPPFMTKRARWLVVLGFLLPGSAQVLSGNRRLGRFGLGTTIFMLALAAVALLGLLFARAATLTVLTNTIVLFVLQWVMLAYGMLWLILGLDTLRNTRLVTVLKKWRIPIAMLSIVLTIVPVAGAAWASTLVASGRGALSDVFVNRAPSVAPIDGRYNILLLGADAGEDREGLRPDSISLVSIDAESGQSVIIGLPRELTEMPFPVDSPMHELHPSGFGMDWGCYVGICYLNAVFAEAEYFTPELYPDANMAGSSPGIEATKDAVEGATGLEVQFFVLIDMAGFEQLIDALGGVTIDVQERLPIGGDAFGNGIEGWIEPGTQHMNGYTAQWYARSRYTTDDYDRMRRQRELQSAILAQMTPANVLLRFQELAGTGSALVSTDLPESMLGVFVDLAVKAKNYTPVTVELTPPNVNPEYPIYETVHNLVRAGVAEATPAPEGEDEGE